MEEKTFFLKEEMSLSFSSRVMTEEKIFYISYSCIATEEEEIFSSFSFSFMDHHFFLEAFLGLSAVAAFFLKSAVTL